MNVEGVKNDSKATPLRSLPPPELASGKKLDASTAVLDYNEILQSMDGPQKQQQPPEEYYEDDDMIIEGDDDNDDIIYEEPPRRTAAVVRHRNKAPVVRQQQRVAAAAATSSTMPSCEPPPAPPSLLWKYRRTILVAAVAAVALYVLTTRLPGWLPRSVGPSGGFSVIGMAIVTLAIVAGFFVGDEYVLATWKGH